MDEVNRIVETYAQWEQGISIGDKALKALLGAIPFAGTGLGELSATAMEHFLKKKRSIFLGDLLKEGTMLPPNLAKDVSFLMELQRTVQVIDRLATEDKVRYFASLLKNTFFTEETANIDEFEEAFVRLRDLSNREIGLLALLYRFELQQSDDDENAPQKRSGDENRLQRQNRFWDAFLHQAQKDFGLNGDDVTAMLTAASRSGFCREVTGSYFSYPGGVFFTTPLLRQFVMKVGALEEINTPQDED